MIRRRRELDPAHEAQLRAALRQLIVPPSTPEYLRYRVDGLAADSTASGRRLLDRHSLRGWFVPRLVSGRRAVAIVAALVALVSGAFLWQSRQAEPSSPVPTGGVSVWSPGTILNWGLVPGGGGFVYVDGAGLYVTHDFGQTWSSPRQLPPSDSAQGHLWDVGTLDFVDESRGWLTVVWNGAEESRVLEYRTEDGGQTWRSSDVTSFAPGDASAGTFTAAQQHFTDAQHGRVILSRTSVNETTHACDAWVTNDAGRTWTGQPGTSCIGLYPEVRWVSRSLGYAISGPSENTSGVSVTMDGGLTWNIAGLPGSWAGPSPVLLTVDAANQMTLVVTDRTGPRPLMAFVSNDAGKSWTGGYEIDLPASLTVQDTLTALDASHWIAVVEEPPTEQCAPTATAGCAFSSVDRLMETHDSGGTWTNLGSQRLYDAGPPQWWDSSHAFLMASRERCANPRGTTCPDDKAIFVTSDGGLTWRATLP